MSPAPGDSNGYDAHAIVEKWSPKQMEKIEKLHGKKNYSKDELLALGEKPEVVTDDVVGDRPTEGA
jgi:hypothetical protein